MNLTWFDVAKIAVTSGIVTALLTQLFSWLREMVQRRFTRQDHLEERDHQRKLKDIDFDADQKKRIAADHMAARAEYLPDVQRVHEWLLYNWTEDHGLEADYANANNPAPEMSDVSAVMRGMRRISTGHPTAGVRAVASKLHGSMDTYFNEVYPPKDIDVKPTFDDYKKWVDLVESVIDAMHTIPVNATSGEAEIAIGGSSAVEPASQSN